MHVLKLRFELLIAVLQFLDRTGKLADLAFEPFQPHHQVVAALLPALPLPLLALVLTLGRLSRRSEALAATKKIVDGNQVADQAAEPMLAHTVAAMTLATTGTIISRRLKSVIRPRSTVNLKCRSIGIPASKL